MCGICGIFDPTGHAELSHERLGLMADTMAHRGPDDQGTYISPDRRVGLGFRRLSIVDLSSAGHQPMSNEDGTVWIVFNGEIYNHADLRRELEARGHVYGSRTDTESVVHGYEEWGADVVHRLRGMFAFAIWDEDKGELFLARDRIGIKPLYYTQRAGRFVFASEIKAILSQPGVERQVNEDALDLYLSFAAVPAPQTLFDGVYKLPAGHRMWVDAGGHVRVERYWDALFPEDQGKKLPEAFYVERLRELLQESVRLRMMSDVPFGVFLSGGIDSSLNVALMSQLMDRPVDTFSVAIRDDPRSDEFSHARRAAQHFGANHREVVIDSSDFLRFLPRMAYHQDEPLADPVCVPLYYVAELARRSGTIVIQVGEGSDELFCGYRSYARYLQIHPYWRRFAALPQALKRPLADLSARLLRPSWARYLLLAAANEPLFSGGAIGFTEGEKRVLLNGRLMPGKATGWVNHYYDVRREAGLDTGLLEDIIYLELKHRLPELLLMRVDKMTMATSIEARVPYLDQELVRFALSIPAELKCRNGRLKHILKRAARGLLPDDIIDRVKAGFCGSASNMVRGPIVDATESLVRRNGDLRALLDWTLLHNLCERNRRGDASTGFKIWLLLNLALWHLVWIQGIDPDRILEFEELVAGRYA